eukprot:TRINITY_DN78592_c0_g1_i1.p1 TRINITY_DN78592_c0_g1~~TRINITY_DN78592_c0_g1_i1.p1  ORF type:complete len:179 (-),score=13.70 TRINITY_DN78592_c0_g1_i1:36-572(-)
MQWSRSSREYCLRTDLDGWDGIGYKVVAKVGSRYLSVWAAENTEYAIGVSVRDEARPNHGGGLYVCRSQEAALRHRIPARRGGLFMAPRALMRCRCEGPFVEYSVGKVACTQLTPLEVLPMPRGYLHSAPSYIRPLPERPITPTDLQGRGAQPSDGMRAETSALEAEVAELERRLGYR